MISIDAKKLSESLSNFYSEYGYKDLNIDFFVNLYLEMADALDEYLNGIRRDQTVKSMDAFKKFNFAVLNGHGATYDLSSILLDTTYAGMLSLSGSLSEREDKWRSTPLSVKATILTKLGKYITISAKRVLDLVEPEILALDLTDIDGRAYVEGYDYFLQDNKLFLLGSAATASVQNSKIIAYNIFVNYKTPEDLLGSRIGIGYSNAISYPEYRDFLQMVTHVLIKGPTVANLKDAFNTLAGWSGSNIIDKISATGVRSAMWKNPDTAVLTPFDFLVIIPATVANTVGISETGELVAKSDRIDIFKLFIDIVKPLDTSYIMALSNIIPEVITVRDYMSGIVTVPLESGADVADEQRFKIKMCADELFTAMPLLQSAVYDTETDNYDALRGYDETSLDENVPGIGYGDLIRFNYIQYPQFPVSFNAVKDILSGQVTCTFKDNATQVNGYKIYRNGVVIQTITPANGNDAIKTYIDTQIPSLPSGSYEYKAFSFYMVGETVVLSRPSKIVTIVK